MQKSKIEWTDATWNPVTGCTKVSQGCKNCYAETMHNRFNGKGSFNTVTCKPDKLQEPFKWKTPRLVFVNSMSDLFHEAVPMAFIFDVFSVMMQNRQHTYQILTKRPQRMKAFIEQYFTSFYLTKYAPNIWLGVSVEDQPTANERIPILLQIPAATKFLSCEPLLGKLDLMELLGGPIPGTIMDEPPLQWVIVGGESGPKARPMCPLFALELQQQCQQLNIPFFFKQWGAWMPAKNNTDKGVKNIIFKSPYYSYNFFMQKVGKHKSGNLLYGKTYQQFPK